MGGLSKIITKTSEINKLFVFLKKQANVLKKTAKIEKLENAQGVTLGIFTRGQKNKITTLLKRESQTI